jgi:hypothetical protein
MHTEVSSENYSLTRPESDLGLQQSTSSGTLNAASSQGGDDLGSTASTQIGDSAPAQADFIAKPHRRRALPRRENGSGMGTGVAEFIAAMNSDEGTTGVSGTPRDEEAALAEQIGQLWFSVQFRTREIRRNSKERAAFKDNLARHLHRYKALLVRMGRSGKWSAFLRDNEIPRATADRYVLRWERSLTKVVENRLAEPISPPTAEEVTRMVNRIKPKLLRVLTTADAVEQFMAVLGAALQVPRSS